MQVLNHNNPQGCKRDRNSRNSGNKSLEFNKSGSDSNFRNASINYLNSHNDVERIGIPGM